MRYTMFNDSESFEVTIDHEESVYLYTASAFSAGGYLGDEKRLRELGWQFKEHKPTIFEQIQALEVGQYFMIRYPSGVILLFGKIRHNKVERQHDLAEVDIDVFKNLTESSTFYKVTIHG